MAIVLYGKTKRCPKCKATNERRATRCIICGVGFPKYGNKKVVIDGVTFDSGKEAGRYVELRMREKMRELVDLKVHPRYPIVINGVKVCTYVADFSYYDMLAKCNPVEDTKGVRTQAFVIKKKLMLAVHGIKVREI